MRDSTSTYKRNFMIAATLAVAMPSLANISSRMFTYEFTGMEYIGYYLKMWLNAYEGYPFVVKASVAVLVLSIFMIIILSFALVYDKVNNGRKDRFYNKINKKYGEVLREIIGDPDNLADKEVLDRTKFKDEGWKGWRMFYVGRLITEAKAAVYDNYNGHNVSAVVRVFGLHEFVENELTYGSFNNRVKCMQLAQFLMIDVAESILVRLLNDNNKVLRKEVRMYYVWLSEYHPFRMFTDEKTDYEYRPWDSLEIHHLLRARRIDHKEIPSLVPVVSQCPDKRLKSCLIREVAYWGSYEDMVKMRDYITDKEEMFRRAAIQCMGIAKFEFAEQPLEQNYSQQSEELKVETLYAILRIRSGKALPFFVGAFGEASVATTKFAILLCMWLYNEESRDTFEMLESSTGEKDKIFFQEVRACNEDPTK